MLFMVIENFKNGDFTAVGQRFKARGRMLPDGVVYHASWIDKPGGRCFQIVEASDGALLKSWTRNWDDLVDFEVIAVQTSADFWASLQTDSTA